MLDLMMKMIMSRKSSFDDAKVRGKHAMSVSTTTAMPSRHKSERQQQEPLRRRRLSGSSSVSEPKTTRDVSTIAAKETSQPSNVSCESATVADVTQLTAILERALPLLKKGAYDTTVLSPMAKTLIECLTKQHLDEDIVVPLCLVVAAIQDSRAKGLDTRHVRNRYPFPVAFFFIQLFMAVFNFFMLVTIISSFFPTSSTL